MSYISKAQVDAGPHKTIMTITVTGQSIEVSDGYHTINELYDHRIALFIALCKARYLRQPCWKSLKHSDGSCFEGWFVLGLHKKAGEQITYHLPMKEWPNCEFADTLDQAPDYDGHTPVDVLERLSKL